MKGLAFGVPPLKPTTERHLFCWSGMGARAKHPGRCLMADAINTYLNSRTGPTTVVHRSGSCSEAYLSCGCCVRYCDPCRNGWRTGHCQLKCGKYLPATEKNGPCVPLVSGAGHDARDIATSYHARSC